MTFKHTGRARADLAQQVVQAGVLHAQDAQHLLREQRRLRQHRVAALIAHAPQPAQVVPQHVALQGRHQQIRPALPAQHQMRVLRAAAMTAGCVCMESRLPGLGANLQQTAQVVLQHSMVTSVVPYTVALY